MNVIAALFFTGALSSVGPCITPRYLALAAIGVPGDIRARLRHFGAFALGTLTVYLATAFAGATVARLMSASWFIDVAAALALIGFGIGTLLRSGVHECRPQPSALRGNGSSFFLGCFSSLVVSPCCTPILLGLGSITSGVTTPLNLLLMVAAFTAGHLAPAAMIFAGCARLVHRFERYAQAMRTVNAGILIALGGYYGMLA
jgi:cytochrome c-type biogenesis protein